MTRHFLIKTKFEVIKLNHSDILYVRTHETKSHLLQVVTAEQTYEFSGTLAAVEQELGTCFLRCHRSFLVNVDRIKTVNFKKRTMQFENKEEVVFARNRSRDVLTTWLAKEGRIR